MTACERAIRVGRGPNIIQDCHSLLTRNDIRTLWIYKSSPTL